MSDRLAGAVAAAPPGTSGCTRAVRALWLVVATAILSVLAAALAGVQPLPVLAAFVVPLLLVSYQRVLLAWQTMLGLIVVVILYIPIRRYTVAGGSPIALEPYRVLIALVLACWAAALAADPRIRWNPTGFGAPVIVLWVAILASLATNLGRVSAANDLVIKQISFLASYFLITCFIASVIKPGAQLDRMIRLLVGGGAVLACFAIVESRTQINAFNGLGAILPFLHYHDLGDHLVRGSGARALASAQHPIALGAALVMLMPLALYLFQRSRRWIWLVAGALLTVGSLSTGSRTVALMLIVLFVGFFWLKRAEMMRFMPLILLLMVMINAVTPGSLGAFRSILNPSSLIEEQSFAGGTGAGRIADLGPTLAEWSAKPFAGQGYGTRTAWLDGLDSGAQILDDQWLSSLLEIGALGVAALLWLFCRAIRRLARRARADSGPDGWLAAALAASIASFGVGMLTFDAFAFIQVTFFFFIMLAFAAVATREEPRPASLPRDLA